MHYDPRQVYQPEADTYLLLDATLNEVRPGDRVLEVGTGSGFIAGELSKRNNVVATEINPHAAICAHTAGIDVVRCNLVDPIRGLFDLVIFNPPYLPTEPHERIDDWLEYALDGGETGQATIERFAADVARVLAPEGRILLLVSSLTGLNDVKNLFTRLDFSSDVVRQENVEDEILYVLRIHQ